jgi:hypothetical protein
MRARPQYHCDQVRASAAARLFSQDNDSILIPDLESTLARRHACRGIPTQSTRNTVV